MYGKAWLGRLHTLSCIALASLSHQLRLGVSKTKVVIMGGTITGELPA